MTLRLSVAALAIVAAACASAGGNSARTAADCVLLGRDSVFAAAGPVYRDCNVDRVARFVTNSNVHPDFRVPTTSHSSCYSTDLEFVVDAKGKPETETARVIRGDPTLGASFIATLYAWKYEPAFLGQVPVRQIVTTHQQLSVVVVVVPKGSGPPTGPPPGLTPHC